MHYQSHISDIFQRNWLTNNGPCVEMLTEKLKGYLGVEHLLLVANGTLALHVAYQTMSITKTITTPFTFAATSGALRLQNIQMRFSDVCDKTFNLDPKKVKEQDLEWADSLVPVHVFGNPCDVNAIQSLAEKYNLKVIYDAAHCFGSEYQGQSLLNFGDCATLSLHATKMFHSVEGGAIIFKHQADFEKAKKIINFGQNQSQLPVLVGTNAKMSEMHAAMGLSVFESVDLIMSHRRALQQEYIKQLTEYVDLQEHAIGAEFNGAYMPTLLKNQDELLYLKQKLEDNGIQTRRYFYPCLSDLDTYAKSVAMPNARSISSRILCLPMYYDLSFEDVGIICNIVKSILTNFRQKV
nr:DegT/DnrJ/EryC1/StrS family aminotransferase [Pseudoalteromonas sp. S16_S37]